MECRLYAEDPENNFFPSPGKLVHYAEPGGPGVRVDGGVYQGWTVPIEYDPLLAKLTVWGETRQVAIERMRRALAEYRVGGITTNLSLFEEVMKDESFRAGKLDTAFLDRFMREWKRPQAPEETLLASMVAVGSAEASVAQSRRPVGVCNRERLAGPCTEEPAPVKFKVEAGEETFELGLAETGTALEFAVTGVKPESGTASVVPIAPGVYSVLLGTKSITINLSKHEGMYEVSSGGYRLFMSVTDKRDRTAKQRPDAASGPVDVRAQMPGKIISLLVAPGAEVEAGQSLLVIEAMKMQNELKSPRSGIVSRLLVSEGETVPANHKLIVIE